MLGLAMAETLSQNPDYPIDADSPLPNDAFWLDGTSMSLAVAESLAEMNGVDQRDQMIRYTSWFRYGHLSATGTCTNIDDATRAAILRFERTWSPLDTENTDGDSCLARVAPIAIFAAASAAQARHDAALCTQTTHAGIRSVAACQFLATMMQHILHGHDREAIGRMNMPLDASPAWTTLGAARDSFLRTTDFAQGCQLCRPHGPRAMAVLGQLAGASLGAANLPLAWRTNLVQIDLIERLASALTTS